tara:strand:+ start:791 stop:1756 length:966 start_codon:yes stop_codon:yes gene_type:complete
MKKKLLLITALICIGLITFGIISSFKKTNLLEKQEISKDIDDNQHQKNFNKDFKSYSIIAADSINFAGEYAPLYAPEIWERYDKEIHKNVYWQSNTIFYFKRANKFFPIIEPILAKNNIPNDFKYLAVIESGLENVVSPAGAAGFWQFMRGTAKDYGMEVNSEIDERYHLEKSTQAACEYLQKAYNKFGNWTLAAASYNMGMYGLERRLNQQITNNYYDLYLNTETSRYIFRLLAVKEIFENKEKYGFNLRKKDLYMHPNTKEVKISSSNINLFEYADKLGINYKILKELNPWIRDNKITNKEQNTFILQIPDSEINIFKN